MRLFKKLIASILISTAVAATPYSVAATETPLNKTVLLETNKLTDTFLVENIKGTHVTTGVTEYRITNTYTIQAKGTYIAGVKNHTSTDYWVPILKDNTGTPLDNIVKISADYVGGSYLKLGVLVALSADGNVYVGTSEATHMVKVSELNNIVDASVEVGGMEFTSGFNSTYYCINAIDSSGNLTRAYFGGANKTNAGTTLASISTISDKTYTKLYTANSISTKTNGYCNLRLPVYSIDNESKLYKAIGLNALNPTGYYTYYKGILVGSAIASNVKDVSYNGMLYILTNRGQLFYSDSLNEIAFTRDGERVTPMVYSIISNSGSVSNSCFVYTDMGPALVQADKGYILDFGFTPVYIWNETDSTGYVMDDQGDIYSFAISTGITSDSFTKEIKEDWANQNPIIPIWNSVEFNINFNQIIERNKSFDLVFSVISNKTPRAFDIYYAKSNEVTNRSLWKTIQPNVARDSLKPLVEGTKYTDKFGQPINKITYTYNWNIPDGDMSNIQLIIDPIY